MIDIIFNIIILVFSVSIHEMAHGAMAEKQGDKTARDMGRVTLNPIKHIDIIGSILVPLFLALTNNPLFAWAKPVPINPHALRDKKYGEAKVAIAGPLANISLVLIFTLVLRVIPFGNSLFYQNLVIILRDVVWINLFLAILNLIPVPPLDGSHILFAFLPKSAEGAIAFLNQFGFFFVIMFIYFVFPFFGAYLMQLFQFLVGPSPASGL